MTGPLVVKIIVHILVIIAGYVTFKVITKKDESEEFGTISIFFKLLLVIIGYLVFWTVLLAINPFLPK